MLAKTVLRKIAAMAWWLLISILFFLPGSTLPQTGLFNFPYFDKLVHLGFFAVLLFLWRFSFGPHRKNTFFLLLAAFGYGLAVEVVQHYLIINRSFDMADVVADMSGAVIGVLAWQGYIKK